MPAHVMLPASPLQPWSIGTSISKRRVPFFGSWGPNTLPELAHKYRHPLQAQRVEGQSQEPQAYTEAAFCLHHSVLRRELPSLQEEAEVPGLPRVPEGKSGTTPAIVLGTRSFPNRDVPHRRSSHRSRDSGPQDSGGSLR